MKASLAPRAPAPSARLPRFLPAADLARCEVVPARKVPAPYRELLAHERHMTTTLEAHHGDRVGVRVLAAHQRGDVYTRKILLALRGTGRVVEFSLVRVRLALCSLGVRQEIVAGRAPLGRILTDHGVPRAVELAALLRVVPGPALRHWFGLDRSRVAYGRLACISLSGRPAVEVLEVLPPEQPGLEGPVARPQLARAV
jgi:chorismate-pyruvate lyase